MVQREVDSFTVLFFDFFNETLYSQQVNETNKSKSVETYCTVSLSVAQHFSALFYLSFEQTWLKAAVSIIFLLKGIFDSSVFQQ